MTLSVFQVIGVIFKHWGTLSRIVELGAPVLTEYRKVSEELNEHLNTISVALGLARNATPEALSLDTKWIQGRLNAAGATRSTSMATTASKHTTPSNNSKPSTTSRSTDGSDRKRSPSC